MKKTNIFMPILSLAVAFVGCRFDSGILRALPIIGIMLFLLSISLIGARVERRKARRKRRRSH